MDEHGRPAPRVVSYRVTIFRDK
eukprot:COSAG06_NODE_14630_length_1141_cov_1.554702_2_plen_22_part_01